MAVGSLSEATSSCTVTWRRSIQKGGDGAINGEEDRLLQRQPLGRSSETEEKLAFMVGKAC